MEDVHDHTIKFSDQSDRETEVLDTAEMTNNWSAMFGDDPPNTVLVEHQPSGTADSLVVVLSDPVYDAIARTMTYGVVVLADENHPDSVDGLVGEAYEEIPLELGTGSARASASSGGNTVRPAGSSG